MYKKKSLILSAILFIALISFVLFGVSLSNIPRSFAEESPLNLKLYSPDTPAEITELNLPQDVFYFKTLSDDEYISVIQNNNELLISKNGNAFTKVDSPFTSLKQVKNLNDRYLLISDDAAIYTVDLQNGYAVNPVKYTESGVEKSVNGNNFDVFGNKLITGFSTTAKIYKMNGVNVESYSTFEGINANSPISINGDYIFYVNGSNLYKVDVNLSSTPSVIQACNPEKMIVDEDYVYYILGNKINRVSIDGAEYKQFTFEDETFDLGKINVPSGLSFKGDNLLISDAQTSLQTNNFSIQEFEIEDSTLKFTGYAIAKNKTAFNRISETNFEISQNENAVAIFDLNKITFFYNDGSFDNLLIEDEKLSDLTVGFFALGKDTFAVADKTQKKIRIFDIDTFEYNDVDILDDGILQSLVYGDGNYYTSVLKLDLSATGSIYKVSEDDFSANKIITYTECYTGEKYPDICYDITGGIFLTDAKNDKIYFYSYNGEEYVKTTVNNATSTGVNKILSDLGSGLFALKDKTICYYPDLNSGTVITKTVSEDKNVSSFSLSFDSKNVYFILEGDERIYLVNDYLNMATTEFTVPAGYKTHGENADINNLKIYEVNDNAKAFQVNKTDNTKFDYSGIFEISQNEFFFIASTDYTTLDKTVNYSVLVTLDELKNPTTVIVKTSDLTEITETKEEIKTAYVFTPVCAYYIPIISENKDFTVLREGSVVKLDKNSAIITEKKITFLGKDFYYATAKVNGNEVKCYIPVDFTVDVLSEDVVIYNHDYVDPTVSNAVRNTLIITALCVCVFMTSLYLIYRKHS